MAQMRPDELIRLLRECGGEQEEVDLDGEVLDVALSELGYDSLAVLQTTGRIERDYGVELPDETLAEGLTPRLLLDAVNDALAKAA